jgi:hypothetical protein
MKGSVIALGRFHLDATRPARHPMWGDGPRRLASVVIWPSSGSPHWRAHGAIVMTAPSPKPPTPPSRPNRLTAVNHGAASTTSNWPPARPPPNGCLAQPGTPARSPRLPESGEYEAALTGASHPASQPTRPSQPNRNNTRGSSVSPEGRHLAEPSANGTTSVPTPQSPRSRRSARRAATGPRWPSPRAASAPAAAVVVTRPAPH